VASRTRLCAALAAALLAAAPAHAQIQRQHGPHVHGTTTVDIGLDGSQLEVDVDGPGANFAGFEHAPRDADERRRLDDALAAMRAPDGWLRLPAAAGCRLTASHVADPTTPHADGHADMEADYHYACASVQALDHLDLGLAQRFPLTRKIVVNLALPGGQGQQVLEGGQQRVTLAPAA
jgi:hypothetical protein